MRGRILLAVAALTFAAPAFGAVVPSGVLEQIRVGKQLLDRVSIKGNQVALAVRNRAGEIKALLVALDVINVYKKQKGKKGRYKKVLANVIMRLRVPAGYSVTCRQSNGVNTLFEVEGHTVLALKRMLAHGAQTDGKPYAIYVPFGEGINVEDLQYAGLRSAYYKSVAAQQRLLDRGVKSHAFPGKLVGDIVSPEVPFVLSVIEHIDPDRFEVEPTEKLTNEALVILGANQEVAFRYTVSPAKARGLWQHIRRTYDLISGRNKGILIENFVKGMNDHVNGAMATYLLFDNDLSHIAHVTGSLPTDPDELAMIIAASYNCGAGRVAKSLNGGHLRVDRLPGETQVYLRKFAEVWRLLKGRLVPEPVPEAPFEEEPIPPEIIQPVPDWTPQIISRESIQTAASGK